MLHCFAIYAATIGTSPVIIITFNPAFRNFYTAAGTYFRGGSFNAIMPTKV